MNAARLFAALPWQAIVFVAMKGAAPLPVAGCFPQRRFHRILLGVADGSLQMRLFTDERVAVIFLPERTPPTEQLVAFARGPSSTVGFQSRSRLPRMSSSKPIFFGSAGRIGFGDSIAGGARHLCRFIEGV